MFRENRLPKFFASMLMLGAVTSSAHAYLTTANGAAADGVTDDTSNLQLALTYCSNNDLVCEIPAGKTHYVTGPLFIWGGASLRSTAGGGLKLDDAAANQFLINIGISGKDNGDGTHLEEKFSGDISNVTFTMAGASSTPSLAFGRILYFWRTDGAEITDNIFHLGTYGYSPTGSGNNNDWVVNGSTTGCAPNCRLIRNDISITGNLVVADQLALTGFEGISIDGFQDALIENNVVTGVGDDPIAVHFSDNVQVLSNTLRSVDGRIFISGSKIVEVADNKHIRIPSRQNDTFYQGLGLIHVGFENPGSGVNTRRINDYIDIHDNYVYYPAGSHDIQGAITIFSGRHTTALDNVIVNDQSTSSYFSVYIGSQIFATSFNDPDNLDNGTYSSSKYARTHDITVDGTISGSTSGLSTALQFAVVGNCDTHAGTITLTDNSAPGYLNVDSIYETYCPAVIATDPTHPNVVASTSFTDTDSDGYPDLFDNCPSAANADQFDLDGNGVGDVCQHGLTAEYHDVSTLINDPVLRRIDPAIDFNWGMSNPGLDVPEDYFSVHWTGRVVAPVTGTYEFCVLGDDGIRLWVNETELLDFWEPQDSVTNCRTIALTADQSAPIELDFFDHDEHAIVKMTWSYPGQATPVVVPTSALYAR